MKLAPQVDLIGARAYLPNGNAGVYQTIRMMRSLVERYKTDLGIRNAATTAIFLTPERSALYEVDALFSLVRDSIRYVRDVHGVETLMSPDKTLALRLGDCDDQSVLLATLLESVGYPTRFVAAGYSVPGQLEHVYLDVKTPDGWLSLDPTEYHGIGWAPPDPVSTYIEGVNA